jgi:hypothetical protein
MVPTPKLESDSASVRSRRCPQVITGALNALAVLGTLTAAQRSGAGRGIVQAAEGARLISGSQVAGGR